MNNPNPIAEPEKEQEFHLKLRITPKRISYEDEQSQGKLGIVERDVILLVPEETTQMYQFFTAWLGIPGKLIEVVLRFDHPYHTFVRASVEHPNDRVAVPHLFLMNYGFSQLLLAQKTVHGQVVSATVLKASEDHPDGSPTDRAEHGELPFEQKAYD